MSASGFRAKGYHGTLRVFDAFSANPPLPWSHATSGLGTFLSARPEVAALFVMNPDLVDAADDSPGGTRRLLSEPWQVADTFDLDTPFDEGARILACEVCLSNPFRMTAVDYVSFVETISETDDMAAVYAFRHRLEAEGHDGIVVSAWTPENGLLADGSRPWAEYDADIFVAFDSTAVRIIEPLDLALLFPASDSAEPIP